jgi:NitT/TauT family transport system ATP-binding protein
VTALIEVRDLVVRSGDRPILDRLSFDVDEGEFLCILGPSGSGKTTLLRVLAGLLLPTSGTIRIGGETAARAWASSAFVFQSARLVPWRTARANVRLGPELRSGRVDERAVDAYVALVGLTEHADRYPALLSGGERQRTALARALAVEPAIMYVDEPFNALDAAARVRIREELRGIWTRQRRTILFVTHDVDEAESLGTRRITVAPPTSQIATVRPPAPPHRHTGGTLRAAFGVSGSWSSVTRR